MRKPSNRPVIPGFRLISPRMTLELKIDRPIKAERIESELDLAEQLNIEPLKMIPLNLVMESLLFQFLNK